MSQMTHECLSHKMTCSEPNKLSPVSDLTISFTREPRVAPWLTCVEPLPKPADAALSVPPSIRNLIADYAKKPAGQPGLMTFVQRFDSAVRTASTPQKRASLNPGCPLPSTLRGASYLVIDRSHCIVTSLVVVPFKDPSDLTVEISNLESLPTHLMASQVVHCPTGADDFEPKKPSRTDSWERVVVFDPESNNVDIRTKRKVRQDKSKYSQLAL